VVAVLGPVVLDIIVAMGNVESSIIKVLVYMFMVWYVGYILLVVVLCIASSAEIERAGGAGGWHRSDHK
jgi:hypothetical protein